MTLYIRISGFEFTPDYFTKLLGCIHKWLGEDNKEHGRMSLYCYSNIWNNYFFFSSWDRSLCIRLSEGIMVDPQMWGRVRVEYVDHIRQTSYVSVFRTTSPVFAKQENRHTFDAEAAEICKKLLITKAKIARVSLPDFTLEFKARRDKLIKIHDISNRCAHYEVHISNQKVANFALCVGLGHCTGVGFGHIMPKLH